MNLSYFISKRIRQANGGGFSSVIHKIAIASIAIGLAAAIVSFLIMKGFQETVKNRIYSFSAHLLVTKYTLNNSTEEQPFDSNVDLYNNPKQFKFTIYTIYWSSPEITKQVKLFFFDKFCGL